MFNAYEFFVDERKDFRKKFLDEVSSKIIDRYNIDEIEKSSFSDKLFDGDERISIPFSTKQAIVRDKITYEIIEKLSDIEKKNNVKFDLKNSKALVLPNEDQIKKAKEKGFPEPKEREVKIDSFLRKIKEEKLAKDLSDFQGDKREFFINQWDNIKRLDENEEFVIIITRNPIDVLRMSDFDGITSCHSQPGKFPNSDGEYFYCAINDSIEGAAVAFLVEKDDFDNFLRARRASVIREFDGKEIFRDNEREDSGWTFLNDPVRRLRIRRFANDDESINLFMPEIKVYKEDMPGLAEVVRDFCYSKQKDEIKKLGIPIDVGSNELDKFTKEYKEKSNKLNSLLRSHSSDKKEIGDLQFELSSIQNKFQDTFNIDELKELNLTGGRYRDNENEDLFAAFFFDIYDKVSRNLIPSHGFHKTKGIHSNDDFENDELGPDANADADEVESILERELNNLKIEYSGAMKIFGVVVSVYFDYIDNLINDNPELDSNEISEAVPVHFNSRKFKMILCNIQDLKSEFKDIDVDRLDSYAETYFGQTLSEYLNSMMKKISNFPAGDPSRTAFQFENDGDYDIIVTTDEEYLYEDEDEVYDDQNLYYFEMFLKDLARYVKRIEEKSKEFKSAISILLEKIEEEWSESKQKELFDLDRSSKIKKWPEEDLEEEPEEKLKKMEYKDLPSINDERAERMRNLREHFSKFFKVMNNARR